jgi:hypothetical protein
MALSAASLVLRCSASRPKDNVSASGGAKDPDFRPTFTQLLANDDIEVVSSSAGDTTPQATVEARTPAGVIETSSATTLTGTTPVQIAGLSAVDERVLEARLGADAAGTVTFQRRPGGASICAIPPGERGVHCMFYNSASAAVERRFYEKVFWENIDSTLALTEARIRLTGDPSSVIMMAVEDAKGDSSSLANRLEEDADTTHSTALGLTFVDDNSYQSVPGGYLGAGENIGVWLKMTLAADRLPVRDTATLEISGSSA